MFFFPLRTDAPIYHWPWVTVLMIAANIASFVVTGGGAVDQQELWQNWWLVYGNGLHPLQWVSMNFLHFGVWHLLGNMIFLWGFGLVVEGKIGWWRYLLVYFGIGAARAAIEQAVMLGYVSDISTGSGGASGVIFGLLAMSLVWAPKNEVTCFFLLIFRAFVFDMTIFTFSMYYIGMQLLFAAIGGFQMNSEVIHLLGVVVGFPLAAVMLKLNWVDCENWDLFAVLAGTYGHRDEYDPFLFEGTAALIEQPSNTRYDISTEPGGELTAAALFTEAIGKVRTLRRMRELIRSEKPQAALIEFHKLKRVAPRLQLEEADLKSLAEGLFKAHVWSDAVALMEEYVERFPYNASTIRLKLAGLFVQKQNRPRAALRVLEPIPRGSLPQSLEAHRDKIEQRARQLADAGVIELDGQSW
jgi:membrane associated rhomboid family serine protease